MLVVVSVMILAMGQISGAEIVLKAGHISPKTSLEGQAADKFVELVNDKTGGQVVVEMFPQEQLGKATAMIDSTVMGNQDIYVGGNVEFERFSKGLKALGLNYAVPNLETFRKVLKSPLWDELFIQPLDKVGLAVLASDWERGPYRVLVSKRPVRNFDDLKGLKLRIAPLDTWRRSWTALGCQVVVLPWTDVYMGLKQGMVEAVTAPINLVYAMKFTEVAKYMARTDEYWGLLTVVMNKKKFAGLKPELQKALKEAAEEAGQWYMATSEKQVNKDIEKMKKEHGVEYTILDLAPGVELMRPVIKGLEKEGFIPAGIYDRIQALK
ncbi:MAG: TRAP transporter substrate-binding protein [Deltaproteobacteria bacterium]|nr:TRAP transporter substrate-binding protein [Deltaproteobacteria bacterium]